MSQQSLKDSLPTPRQAVVLSRAALLADALKTRARNLTPTPLARERFGRMLAPGRAPGLGLELNSRFGRLLAISFVAIVIVPTLLTALYYAFIASDRFVSEARFAVRSGDRSALDMLAGGTDLGKLAQAQDTLIVTEYIKSRALVEALQKDLDLKAIYTRDQADYFSSASGEDSIEDLVSYWRWRANTSVEMPSGIITLQVSAFTPEDAQALARAVVARSEALVNQMSERANSDELKQAEAEFARAEQKLKDIYGAMRDLRNREGVLDPTMNAEALNELLTELRKSRLQIEGDLIVARETMQENSPVVRQLKAKLAAIDGQIAKLTDQLTASSGGGSDAVSEQMGAFEDMELKRQVAQDQYAAAALALENARIAADRQRIYLSTFVQPELAQEALYPLRLWTTLGVALALLAIWTAFAGLARFARNSTA
jgi:capsular polysaccharide transport system permease protein